MKPLIRIKQEEEEEEQKKDEWKKKTNRKEPHFDCLIFLFMLKCQFSLCVWQIIDIQLN